MHRQRLFSTLIITSTHAIHSISILPFKFHPHRNASLSHPLPISSPSSTQSIPILPFKNQSSSHCISLILFQSILHHPHSPFPFFLSNSILIAVHLSLILFQSILHHPHSPFPFFLSNSILIAVHLPLHVQSLLHHPHIHSPIPFLPYSIPLLLAQHTIYPRYLPLYACGGCIRI